MDPREILHQISRDFECRPHAAAAVAVMIAFGIATWFPIVGACASARAIDSRPPSISVLSDPFGSQTK
jgi:hypothetical protein